MDEKKNADAPTADDVAGVVDLFEALKTALSGPPKPRRRRKAKGQK